MIPALARLVARKGVAWGIIVASFVATAVFAWLARTVTQDDDLLAFLPADNQAVQEFYDIDDSFGGLGVAIVGIEVDNPFERSFLTKLERVTKGLDEEPTIAHALSLANVDDFRASDQGGITTDYLVRPYPETEKEEQALRERVMGKSHIVGNLIGPGGKSVIIYGFLASGADPRATANLVQERVRAELGDHELYWGGAPFISTYIYDTTQADMRRLIPWAVALVVLIIVLSFRDVVGALLALVSTAMGIAVTYGLMGAFGVQANIVLSAMPVILFAVGSAYAIHVMVRYYALRADAECEEALVETLTGIGPTVAAAGLTTVAGLLSFLAMDIGPMRQFGLFTGLGIAASLLLALTFVPAVIRVTELKSRRLKESVFRRGLVALVRVAQRRRTLVAGGLLVLAVAGATMVTRVEARMETAAFFSADSPPAEAEAFLRDRFGGSTFLQIMVEGDMNDPGVLREVRHLADQLVREPHVSRVNHIGAVLSLVNEAMVGERRIPATTPQVRLLYRFLEGRAGVGTLVNDERTRALIVATVDTDAHDVVTPLLERTEARMDALPLASYRVVGRLPAAEAEGADVDGTRPIAEADQEAVAARRRELVQARLLAVLAEAGQTVDDALAASVEERLEGGKAKVDPAEVAAKVATYLTSVESILEEDDYPLAGTMAKRLVALGPEPPPAKAEEVLASVYRERPGARAEGGGGAGGGAGVGTVDDELVADLVVLLEGPLAEAWRAARSEKAAGTILDLVDPGKREPVAPQVEAAMLDRNTPSALLPAAGGDADGTLAVTVSGQPVLYRGLAQSVTENQFKSLGTAFAMVLLIMMALFRSLTAGLLASAPTALTLLVIYGAMGAAGVSLDIGTSMLASIIIGAGVDYAVHLIAAWRGDSLEEAATHAAEYAGPAIWTNALMVAVGFFVLTLGDAKPLENVGNLTAAAMVAAGLTTFLIVPALARRTRYLGDGSSS